MTTLYGSGDHDADDITMMLTLMMVLVTMTVVETELAMVTVLG